MKTQEITSLEDLDLLEGLILQSVETAVAALKQLFEAGDSVRFFAKLKFTEIGLDPLDVCRPLNIVEQLNQTFTYLASVAGARWLVSRHPESLPLSLNLGTTPGYDIQSNCRGFIAETFAVTHPNSNKKLQKDVERLLKDGSAAHKFVFYLSPVEARQLGPLGVTVVRLNHPAMTALTGMPNEQEDTPDLEAVR